MGDLAALLAPIDESATVATRVGVTALSVAVVAVVVWLLRRAKERLSRHVKPTTADLLTSVLAAVTVASAAIVVVLTWGLREQVGRAIEEASPTGVGVPELVLSVATLVAAYVTVGFASRIIDDLVGERDSVTRHQRKTIYRVTQVCIYVVALAIVLGLWTVDVSGLLVGAGFLGIVVGMAARQTLGSLIAGFVLMFSRPFEIGDWVVIGEDEGIVTDITVVNTRIQTFDGEYVMVPNDEVGAQSVTNRTRKGRLRAEVEVGVDYDADVERAVTIAEEAVGDVDRVLAVPEPDVVLKEFGDASILLGLRYWIDDPSSRRMWRARTAVVAAVKDAFEREQIKIPYPQYELSGREEAGGLRVTDESAAPDEEPTPDTETTPDGGER